MSSVLGGGPLAGDGAHRERATWVLAVAGFAAMYLPVYWTAANGIWQTDEQAHGALILAVMLWLFWGLHRQLAAAPSDSAPGWGWALLVAGLSIYFVGRVFRISILEFGSQPFVAAAVLLLLRGRRGVRIAWFPLLYFVFMIPLPGLLVDAMTQPLKEWISSIVVELLYDVGYPISRSGVVLSIGQYQMLVADACSGLHSMYSLSALGTLFMYVVHRRSVAHNAIMLASILPIAFAANIVRVMVLVLITYHLGDEAGQGFLHGAAGIVLMLVALACFVALDALLVRLLRQPPQVAAGSPSSPIQPPARPPADRI